MERRVATIIRQFQEKLKWDETISSLHGILSEKCTICKLRATSKDK